VFAVPDKPKLTKKEKKKKEYDIKEMEIINKYTS
jgi:hypothetical protein